MKKYIITLICALAITASASLANAGFNLGINVGIPAPVYVAPPPAYAPPPVYAAPPVDIEEEPEFVAQPGSGFYMAVGTPYDLFYAGNRYYLCRGDAWYAASYYNGPWARVGYRGLPWGLRRYPIARMRYFRDEAYRHRGDGYYGYRHFHPERHGGWGRQARWEDGGHHGGMMGH